MLQQFQRLLSNTIAAKWASEKHVLWTHRLSLSLLLITYYVQGIVVNILQHYIVKRAALWDFGFQNVAAPLQYLWVFTPISIILRIALFSLTIFSLIRFYLTNRRVLFSVIGTKILIILVAIGFIRICTLFSTQLPPPAPHCYRPNTDTPFNPDPFDDNFSIREEFSLTVWGFIKALLPWHQPFYFSIIPRWICGGDSTFSLHAVGFMLCALIVLKYDSGKTNRVQLFTCLLAIINMLLLVVMRLNYSLDVWVGFFTTLLLFLYLDSRAKDIFGTSLPLQLINDENNDVVFYQPNKNNNANKKNTGAAGDGNNNVANRFKHPLRNSGINRNSSGSVTNSTYNNNNTNDNNNNDNIHTTLPRINEHSYKTQHTIQNNNNNDLDDDGVQLDF